MKRTGHQRCSMRKWTEQQCHLKHAHLLKPLEAIRSPIKKKSKIANQLYVESSDEEDGPSARLNEKMDRTTVS